jgi:hypothetical protein
MNRMNPVRLIPAAAMLAIVGSTCLAQTPDAVDGANPQISAVTPFQGSVSSMWSMSSAENGHTYKSESRNGVITAEIDGTAVPADRIVREGTTVRIRDDKGETVYQTEAPASDVTTHTYSFKSGSTGAAAVGLHGMLAPRAAQRSSALQIDAEPPTVMIGVQLLDPDSSLRGHLGLKENEATLISAVYEGLAAAHAGIEPYDIIVGVDGKSPAAPEAVRKALRATESGKSISLEIIHRGQKKTVTVTPEKFDPEKLDKAKINAIAAATGTPNASAFATLDPDIAKSIEMWRSAGGNAGQPFVAAMPKGAKPFVLWNNQTPAMNGTADMQELARKMQEMAAHAQAEAEAAREQAEQLHQQMLHQGGMVAPGAMNPGMDDRMKKMEEMLQKLMDQREKTKAEDKAAGRS